MVVIKERLSITVLSGAFNCHYTCHCCYNFLYICRRGLGSSENSTRSSQREGKFYMALVPFALPPLNNSIAHPKISARPDVSRMLRAMTHLLTRVHKRRSTYRRISADTAKRTKAFAVRPFWRARRMINSLHKHIPRRGEIGERTSR